MRVCWRYDSRERPAFHQIVKYIAEHATAEFRKLSFVLNDPRFDIGGEYNETFNFDLDLASEQSHDDQNAYKEEGFTDFEDEEESGDNYDESAEEDPEEDAEFIESDMVDGNVGHSPTKLLCRDGLPYDEEDFEKGPLCGNNRRVGEMEKNDPRTASPKITIRAQRSASSADLNSSYDAP